MATLLEFALPSNIYTFTIERMHDTQNFVIYYYISSSLLTLTVKDYIHALLYICAERKKSSANDDRAAYTRTLFTFFFLTTLQNIHVTSVTQKSVGLFATFLHTYIHKSFFCIAHINW